jgi:polyhydroxyalkanoate synthesis regulator phasin
MVNRAQDTTSASNTSETSTQPRRIEILDDDDGALTTDADQTSALRQQVAELRRELDALRQKKENH